MGPEPEARKAALVLDRLGSRRAAGLRSLPIDGWTKPQSFGGCSRRLTNGLVMPTAGVLIRG